MGGFIVSLLQQILAKPVKDKQKISRKNPWNIPFTTQMPAAAIIAQKGPQMPKASKIMNSRIMIRGSGVSCGVAMVFGGQVFFVRLQGAI